MIFQDILRRIGIEIDPRPAEEGARRAKKAIKGIGDETKKQGTVVDKVFGSIKGKIAAAFSVVAVTAFFSSAVQAAGKYETALGSVLKVTNFNAKQTTAFRKEIGLLTREIPRSATELLSISASAGQLGVKGVENVVKFTETVAKLEVATDIMGEQGAKSLARILNITKENVSEVGTLGDALVNLGNNFAASESEIVKMTLELSKGLAIFKVSSREAAGLAAALVSLGQSPELAGSAVSRTFRTLNKLLIEGGEGADKLAVLMGRSAEDIKKAFEDDALGTFTEFLKAVKDSGQDATLVLEQFGLKGDELLKVLPVLVQNLDLMREAQDKQKNSLGALDREAAAAFSSYESKLRLLGNAWASFKVRVGDQILPFMTSAVEDLTESVQGLVEILGALEIAGTRGTLKAILEGVGDKAVKTVVNNLPGVNTKNIDNPDFFFNRNDTLEGFKALKILNDEQERGAELSQEAFEQEMSRRAQLSVGDDGIAPWLRRSLEGSGVMFDAQGRPQNDAAVAIANRELAREQNNPLDLRSESERNLEAARNAWNGGDRSEGTTNTLLGIGGPQTPEEQAREYMEAQQKVADEAERIDEERSSRADQFLSDEMSRLDILKTELQDARELQRDGFFREEADNGESVVAGILEEMRMLNAETEEFTTKTQGAFEEAFGLGVQSKIRKIGTESEQAFALGRKSFDILGNGVSDGLTSILDGTKSVKEGFREMAASILKDLSAMIVKQLVFNALSSAFGGVNPSVSAAQAIPVTGFHGGKSQIGGAGGTPRDLLGGLRNNERPAIIRDNELVLRPEDIQRATQPEPMMASAPVITTSITINSDGSQEVESQVQGEQAEQLGEEFNQAIVQVLIDQKRPGGILAS